MDRRRLLILAAVLAVPLLALAAQGGPVYTAVPTYPAAGGTCTTGRVQIRQDTGQPWCCVASQWQACSAPATYDVLVSYPGSPSASETMARVVMPRAVTIPTNCTGSRAAIGTNPTAQATVTLKKNGVSAGTVTINTNGTTSFTCASPIVLAAGDVLTVTAPSSADATLADISISLTGSM